METNKYKTFILILLFTSSPLWAAKVDNATLGFGTLTNFVGDVQTNKQGDTRKFEFSPYFNGTLRWFFYDNFSVIPELGCELPESGTDDKISRFHYEALVHLGYTLSDLTLTLGAGLAFTRLTSDGSEVTLDNGLGTSTFYMPDSTSTSRNFVQTLGFDYYIYQGWGAQGKAIFYNITDSKKSSWSYFVGVNYFFGQFEWGL